ncbi:MAG: hypothetical protein ABI068_03385 [Ktedonobacterales bacterium]
MAHDTVCPRSPHASDDGHGTGRHDMIVICASAGGVEALTRLVSALPVAQRLDERAATVRDVIGYDDNDVPPQ